MIVFYHNTGISKIQIYFIYNFDIDIYIERESLNVDISITWV